MDNECICHKMPEGVACDTCEEWEERMMDEDNWPITDEAEAKLANRTMSASALNADEWDYSVHGRGPEPFAGFGQE